MAKIAMPETPGGNGKITTKSGTYEVHPDHMKTPNEAKKLAETLERFDEAVEKAKKG